MKKLTVKDINNLIKKSDYIEKDGDEYKVRVFESRTYKLDPWHSISIKFLLNFNKVRITIEYGDEDKIVESNKLSEITLSKLEKRLLNRQNFLEVKNRKETVKRVNNYLTDLCKDIKK